MIDKFRSKLMHMRGFGPVSAADGEVDEPAGVDTDAAAAAAHDVDGESSSVIPSCPKRQNVRCACSHLLSVLPVLCSKLPCLSAHFRSAAWLTSATRAF